MGTLTPGATYIYERSDGKIYARKFGKTDKKIIGYESTSNYSKFSHLWNDILLESEHNVALQHALEKVIILYKLSKNDPL